MAKRDILRTERLFGFYSTFTTRRDTGEVFLPPILRVSYTGDNSGDGSQAATAVIRTLKVVMSHYSAMSALIASTNVSHADDRKWKTVLGIEFRLQN